MPRIIGAALTPDQLDDLNERARRRDLTPPARARQEMIRLSHLGVAGARTCPRRPAVHWHFIRLRFPAVRAWAHLFSWQVATLSDATRPAVIQLIQRMVLPPRRLGTFCVLQCADVLTNQLSQAGKARRRPRRRQGDRAQGEHGPPRSP